MEKVGVVKEGVTRCSYCGSVSIRILDSGKATCEECDKTYESRVNNSKVASASCVPLKTHLENSSE